MFASIKNKPKRDKLIRLLTFLVQAATVIPEGQTAPAGFAMVPEKDAKELVTAEPTLASINPSVAVNAAGQVQVAATPAGIAAIQGTAPAAAASADGSGSTAPTGAAATVASSTTEFVISNDIPLPTIQRGGGRRTSKYPFDKLQLIEGKEFGQSFFVQSTPKAFASTISSQNRKYSKTNPVRKFTLRAVSEKVNGVDVTGVRVWRIAVKPEPPAAPATPAAPAAS